MFGTVADLRALLDGGLNANTATAMGRIPLLTITMPDIEKVKLLLERGADVNARSERSYTSLLVGAQYRGRMHRSNCCSIPARKSTFHRKRKSPPTRFRCSLLLTSAMRAWFRCWEPREGTSMVGH